MAGWDTRPVNSGYTVVVGTTTGNYNNGNPSVYVKTWMEYKVLQDSTDIANNRSRIDVKLYSQVITGGSGTGMANTYTANNYGYVVFDNSNKQYLSTTYDFNNFALNKFADATLTIPHNADGTKTITLQGAFSTISGTWTITGGSASASITLPTIARGTTLTNVTNRYYGYPATFELSRKASNLREQIWIEYGGYSYHINNSGSNANFTYTIPRDVTPNTASPSATSWDIIIYTYNGSTLVDTKLYSGLSMCVWQINPSDTNYKPTFTTPTFSIYNDVVSQFGTYVAVAGYSKLRLSATKAQVTTKYGATVTSRSVTFSGGGGTFSDVNASTYTSNKYSSAGNYTCTYTVTDSRGFSTSWTTPNPINVKSYTAPTVTVASCYRGNSSHVQSDSGTYAWGQATYGICTLAGSDNVNRNSVSAFKAQVTGFSAVNLTSGTLTQLASGLSVASVYTVTFTVTDVTGNSATETRTIPSEDIPLNIREGGKGVGIGAYCEGEGLISVGYQFSGEIKSKGDRIFGTVNFIDMASLERGSWSDAMAFVSGTTRLASNIIEVSANTTYTLSMTSQYGAVFLNVKEWNSSKTIVRDDNASGSTFTFTTSSTTKYIAVHIHYSNNSTILPSEIYTLQLEEGSSASSYVPYAMDNVELTERVSGKKVTFTPTNCTSAVDSNNDGCWYKAIGEMVYVHLSATSLPNANTEYKVGTIPYKPKAARMFVIASYQAGSRGYGYCYVNTSGEIYVSVALKERFWADFSFLAE